jgi:dUTP pyrophosphatase
MPKPVTVRIKRLDLELPLPAYAYPGDAGLDLYAAEDCSLKAHERALIPTGLAVAIPAGYAGFVLPRSGSAARMGLSLVNTPGLIDSQYRGEIVVIAINLDSQHTIEIRRGDRIAQLVILPIAQATLEVVETLDETERSSKGFGSSGL